MATLEDRFAIRDLQERYATESDKNNQDYYSELFVKNVRLRVYFYGELGMQADDVDSMIKQYKAFGAAKASFHQNGQHVIDFQDDTHATGTAYALATLVNNENGKDVVTPGVYRMASPERPQLLSANTPWRSFADVSVIWVGNSTI